MTSTETTLNKRYDGTVNIVGGRLAMNTMERVTLAPAPWTLGRLGVIKLTNSQWQPGADPGGASAGVVEGSPLTVQDEIHAAGGGNLLLDDTTFLPGSAVQLVDHFSHLSLVGATTYRGGSFTGAGTLHQRGDVTVADHTQIEVAIYNWDGAENSPSNTTIESGVSFTLNAGALDTTPPGPGATGASSCSSTARCCMSPPPDRGPSTA